MPSALLLGMAACSNMTGGSSAPRTAAVAPPPVAPEMVRQAQSKLRDTGYYKQSSVDGVWGAGTESAVQAFQRDHNLGVSGKLDMPTLQALNLAWPAPGVQLAAPAQPPDTPPSTSGTSDTTAPVQQR
jgi:peptidoglycan hydrolase-like protein with peptidoglycan-binding domain